ncbi:MAG: hypothetical protein ABI175_26375, partial [Polyangiales bacterium]
MTGERAAAIAIETGALTLGGGLLALVRPALDALEVGGVLAILSSSAATREDLSSWCRLERHDYLGCEPQADGRDRHLVARGALGVPLGARETGMQLPQRDGRVLASDVLA